MFCTKCGQKIEQIIRFCPSCGYDIAKYQDSTENEIKHSNNLGVDEFNSAMQYFEGEGKPQDMLKALNLFIEAADKGNIKACNKIGRIYSEGNGLAPDYKKANDWYKKGAELDDIDAQYNLGVALCEGEEIYTDLKQAMFWMQKAAINDDPDALLGIGGILDKMGKSDESIIWMKKAAEKGSAQAQYNLGVFYLDGIGVQKNADEAFKWFNMAALQGMIEAYNNIGIMYFEGWGINKDIQKGLQLIKKAANEGYSGSQYLLGTFLMDGNIVSRDYNEAYKWFNRCAEQGDSDGFLGIGWYYEEVKKNIIEAEKYYRKAIEMGNENAKQALGRLLYSKGIGKAEYKRFCNQCKNTWNSRIDDEKKLKFNNNLFSYILREFVYGDNASIVNHLENQKLKQLYRCPYCGSSDYNEEIVYI